MNNIFDTIIIGSGAAGLFTAIQAPFSYKKLLLEKTSKLGQKVLLSGGERANVSNIDIEAIRDYFGQNRKAMIGILSKYNQWDIMSFFSENLVNIVEEDRGRLILESGDSRELLDLLVKKAKENNTDIRIDSEVEKIEKKEDVFILYIKGGHKYYSKKVVVASGGKSFYQIGTTGDGYNFASDFGIKIEKPYRGLCGLTTREDLSDLSGISTNLELELLDKDSLIYHEKGPFLFTHFGVSGPIIFNSTVALGEYVNKIKINNYEEYFKDNIYIKLKFNLEGLPKRISKHFDLNDENFEIRLNILDWRSWKEAKVTGGGIRLDELNNNLESKKIPGLYFCGEILDLTGKTGGFNLQQAWSTGYIVGKSL